MTLYLWLVFSRASGDSGNSPYTVGTCRGLFFVPFPSFRWWMEREAPPPRGSGARGVTLAFGTWQAPAQTLLTDIFSGVFFKTKGNIDPALLTLHRRKCETSTAEVTLLSLPRASSRPPLLREKTLTALQSRESERREGSSRARPCPAPRDGAGRVGNAESLLLCPFGSFSFCLHDTVSWESRRAPPSSSCPAGPSPCHPQYHTFFIMALYCSNQYAQYMLNVY